MRLFPPLLLVLLLPVVLFAQRTERLVDDLSIVPLSANTYMHIGMLQTNTFGRVGCNGLVYIRNGEAVVMDTPPDSLQSEALLRWIEKRFPKTVVKAVIVNHFHDDCLAGLPAFHRKGIPSYANALTKNLAAKNGVPEPQHGFSGQWELTVGDQKIESQFLGEAHTKDNIVTWIPSEHILFGGCRLIRPVSIRALNWLPK